MRTPELDKIRAAQRDSQVIRDFLLWAQYNGYRFSAILTMEAKAWGDRTYQEKIETPVEVGEVIAHYFGINLGRAEAERRAVRANLVRPQG